jgi:hypothetical protein
VGRVPGSLRWLSLAVVLTVLPVATGVLVLQDEEEPAPAPEPPGYASTALTDYDTTVVGVGRAAFCDRLPDEALTEALAGEPGPTRDYRNGQSAELAPGVEDVAHEYGCRVTGPRGTEARAWVFAPPVTRLRADELVADAAGRASCTRPTPAPAYGAPSVALVCPAGPVTWASFRGLFGDAWLACSLAAPSSLAEKDLLDRAGRWCVAVAQAASATD